MFYKKAAALLSLTLVAAILSGCGINRVREAQTATAEGTPFSKSLHREYTALAEEKWYEGKYISANGYAGRALTAAEGQPFEPAKPEGWRMPDETLPQAMKADQRLRAALASPAAGLEPQRLARAQASYDCWIGELKGGRDAATVERCRQRFEANMRDVELAIFRATGETPGTMKTAAPAAMPAPAAVAQQPPRLTSPAGAVAAPGQPVPILKMNQVEPATGASQVPRRPARHTPDDEKPFMVVQ